MNISMDRFNAYKKCEDACRNFVAKVEDGRARSVRSYKLMKDAIAMVDKAEKK